MAFGRVGSLGTGFGRLGAKPHGGVSGPVGGAALLANETDGFATDFTYTTDAQRVAVKTAGVTVASALNTFYLNTGTSPKQVFDVAGALGWSPHNMCIQSQAFDQTTPWNPTTTVTVTANVTTAPDGTLTADKIVEVANTSSHQLIHANAGWITGMTYTLSVYAKAAERNWLSMVPLNGFTLADWFDLTNGVVGTSANGGVITSVGSGWYRCSITFVKDATVGGPTFLVRTANGQVGTYAGNASSGLYLWGAQLNRGSTPLIYLPTTTLARAGLAVDYDVVTHVATGLLYELAATNMLLNSAALSTQTVAVANLTTYTLSFWGTGTVTLTGASTAGPLTGSSATTRVSLTFSTTSTSLTLTVTGTVSNAQLELGTVPTSPILTFGATVTRVADNYTFLLSTIPALGSEYSIYARFSTPNIANGKYAVALTDGTANEIAGFVANTTARLAVVDGGVAVGAIIGPTLVANTAASAAARIKLNDCAMSVGGGAAAFDTTVTLPTVTEVRFGGTGNNVASTASFYIEKLMILPRGLSDAELAAKSAL
jgi:hypothetical protein